MRNIHGMKLSQNMGNPHSKPAALGDSLYADDLVTHPKFRHIIGYIAIGPITFLHSSRVDLLPFYTLATHLISIKRSGNARR
jgi:hypothetical protein